MAIMIIIPYILYTLLSGSSVLSGFPCSVLVLCVNTGTFVCCNMNVLSTQALPSVLGKCDVLDKAREDTVMTTTLVLKKKNKKKEFRSVSIKCRLQIADWV